MMARKVGLKYQLTTECSRAEYNGTHEDGMPMLFAALPDEAARRAMLATLQETHVKLLRRERNIPEGEPMPVRKLLHCAAHEDGECHHPGCPQLRDNEPATSGRHCPLDNWRENVS